MTVWFQATSGVMTFLFCCTTVVFYINYKDVLIHFNKVLVLCFTCGIILQWAIFSSTYLLFIGSERTQSSQNNICVTDQELMRFQILHFVSDLIYLFLYEWFYVMLFRMKVITICMEVDSIDEL